MHFQRLIKDFNWSKSDLKSGEPWKRHCLWGKKRDTYGQTTDGHRTNIEFRAHLHNSPLRGQLHPQGKGGPEGNFLCGEYSKYLSHV